MGVVESCPRADAHGGALELEEEDDAVRWIPAGMGGPSE